MKKNSYQTTYICFWLAIISFLLFCGVLLFASYIYKFDPLSTITALFNTDANVIWNAIGVITSFIVGLITVKISIDLATIEKQQSLLYTEPHILIDSLEIMPTELELSSDRKTFKKYKGIDFPYYTNILHDENLTDISVIIVSVINTSEAFARLRFAAATIATSGTPIAQYNHSTVGTPKTHAMLGKGGKGKIGLIIQNDILSKLRESELTFTTILDNNFNDSFRDTQSYMILNICEGAVTIMPYNTSKNEFIKIKKSNKTL